MAQSARGLFRATGKTTNPAAAAFVAMEDAFYSWWEDVLSHYSDERCKEFEADVAQYVVYENFAKSAFMAGVKMERALGKKNSFR